MHNRHSANVTVNCITQSQQTHTLRATACCQSRLFFLLLLLLLQLLLLQLRQFLLRRFRGAGRLLVRLVHAES